MWKAVLYLMTFDGVTGAGFQFYAMHALSLIGPPPAFVRFRVYDAAECALETWGPLLLALLAAESLRYFVRSVRTKIV